MLSSSLSCHLQEWHTMSPLLWPEHYFHMCTSLFFLWFLQTEFNISVRSWNLTNGTDCKNRRHIIFWERRDTDTVRRGLDHTEQSQRQRLWCDIGPAEQYWSQMRTFNSYKAWKPTCNTIDEWESTDKAWWPLVVQYHHQQRTEQPCTMPGNDMQDSPWEASHFKNTMHYWAGIEASTTYVYVSIIHCRVVPQVETLRALKWGYVAKKLCYI